MLAAPTQAILNREPRAIAMHHGKQLIDRSDNAATTTDPSAMCDWERPRAAAVTTTKSESLSGNSIRIISPAGTGWLTRKNPDEIEERHRLENGRSNGGTGRRSR
jgi:hypothetical protein